MLYIENIDVVVIASTIAGSWVFRQSPFIVDAVFILLLQSLVYMPFEFDLWNIADVSQCKDSFCFSPLFTRQPMQEGTTFEEGDDCCMEKPVYEDEENSNY